MRSPAASGWVSNAERGTTLRFTATAIRLPPTPSSASSPRDARLGRNLALRAVHQNLPLRLEHRVGQAIRRAFRGQTGRSRFPPHFPWVIKPPGEVLACPLAAPIAPADPRPTRALDRSRGARRELGDRAPPRGRARRHRGGEGGRLRTRRARRGAPPAARGVHGVRGRDGVGSRRAARRGHRRRGAAARAACTTPPMRAPRSRSVRRRCCTTRRCASRSRTAAASLGRRAPVHVEVDTGMRRLGVPAEEAAALIARVAASRHLALAGVSTHFARADEPDPAPTRAQVEALARVLEDVRRRGVEPGQRPSRQLGGPARHRGLAGPAPRRRGATGRDALRRGARAALRGRGAATGDDAARRR